MYCWGNTANGELGLGGIEDQYISVPTPVKFSASAVKQIACGKSHTLVLTKEGQVYSCGSNDYGQLGHEKSRTKLYAVPGLDAWKIVIVACGENHSLALNEWGQVLSWGCNVFGQLGLNNITDMNSKPRIIKELVTSHVVQIACGYKHSLALTNRGELYTWGSNENGQLGVGLKNKVVPTPTLVSSIKGLPIALIACGASHSFVLSKSGAVYGWGKNKFGQLGLNSELDHVYPTQLKTIRTIKVKYISCGEDFSVFLTQDGGVLTCGAGMYGQLGHGSYANEILPRKVLELMGSTVTQIGCGRRHTLAFILSRNKVFAFGTGGLGQLGNKALANISSPQAVLGPWLDNEKLFVNMLFVGGDQSFVTISNKKTVDPPDFRRFSPETQIFEITQSKVNELERVRENAVVDGDLLTYVETVMSAESCINGSFLLDNDRHYSCNSKNPGVDLALAQSCFASIARIQNESIKNLIMESFCQMITSLPESPPDVETLRLYITLPLFHEFENARHYTKLQCPFALANLRLKTEAGKVLRSWVYLQSEEYFEKLIRIYKNVVTLCLRTSPYMNLQHQWDLNKCGSELICALEFLAHLNLLNQVKSKVKVKHDTFYIPELQDIVDIRVDYVRWALQQRPGSRYFCNYPFLFDATAKTLLLETDQSLQMQSAMNEAAHRAVQMLLFQPVALTIPPFLELAVSRDNIIQDTIRELSNLSVDDLKKPLKVHFIGEEAEDAGGVKKEFFLLLLREVLDPKYGMFVSDSETNCIWFSEHTFEDEMMYYLVGLLCGLAIYNFTIIYLTFPIALYKKLLKEPVGLEDLYSLSPSLAKSLQALLDYEEDNIEDVFCLRFEITREVFGEIRTTPLKPNGSEIPVTHENKEEYVDLYVDYILNTSVNRHYRAFHDAFHRVCGGRVLKLFHAEELMAVVIGNEDYDWDVLESNAQYKGGYTSGDPTIRLFWEVFHELSLEDKKKFLFFLTGTDRIPIQGMKAIKIIIQPTNDEKYLPVAHTCFNLLDLPRYLTKERLKYKLIQAIQQNQGFSLV